jgi:hypothetical protein
MSDLLWCCHVGGPDEVTPCESYEAARGQADELNYHFAPTKWHKPGEFEPVWSAAPMLWPYDAESHAQGLEQLAAERRVRDVLPEKADT